MIKNKFRFTFWLLFYLFVFFFLLHNSYNYLDPDLGWHLKVGQQIINEKTVPHADYYDYTLTDKNWIDHEWAADALSYLIYHHAGYLALNIFFALIIILTLILLNLFLFKYLLPKNNYFVDILAVFFQLLGLKAMAPHLGVRIQEFALLNLFLLLIIIYQYNKNKNYKTLFFLLPLFYFWANIHASFLIGLFVLFFYLIIKLLEIILVRFKVFSFIDFHDKFSLKQIKKYFIFLILICGTILLTPYKLGIVALIKRANGFNAYHLKHIAEWMPAYYFPIQYYQLIYLAIAGAVIILVFFYIFDKTTKENKNKIVLWHFLLLLLFFVLSFKSKRHFPLFFIISFPCLIKFFFNNFKTADNLFLFFKDNKILKLFMQTIIIISLASTAATLVLTTNFIPNPFAAQRFCRQYPCAAVNFLKNNPQYSKQRLFAQYSWGGYIIWNWPGKKLFIDGRLPQYPYAGQTLLAEYFEFFNENSAEEKLNEYNIQLVLMNKFKDIKLNWFEKYILQINKEKLNKRPDFLQDYLADSSNWQLIYEDDHSYAYQRQSN